MAALVTDEETFNAPAKTNDNSRLEVGSKLDAESSSVPDGGWGWMVVFGSFMIHAIADGIPYSFGVFIEDFVDYFDCSMSAVGGLGSLMLGMTWSSGRPNISFHVYGNNNLFCIHLNNLFSVFTTTTARCLKDLGGKKFRGC